MPVVSLTDSPDRALLDAYAVDSTKVELREKERLSQGYVALEINTAHYEVRKWEVDEWWIMEIINPKDITAVREEDYETVRKLYKEKYGN